MVEMELVDVRVDQTTNNPVALLRTGPGVEPRRLLPIFIGVAEATAIRFGMEERATPRPMTHDLVHHLTEAMGATLVRVVITELRDNIFFAELHYRQGESDRVVSSRPSDALALAVRVKVPILAATDLIAAHAIDDPETALDANPDELVDEFRRFIDEINPEDFGAS